MATSSEYNRGIVKYTSRDYDSIMADFWSLVPKMTELWKPEADSDPGVVIAKYIASVADMLGVNGDWLANEILGPSLSQRKNAEKLFGLLGYDLGWYTAARTEVTFTNGSTEPITLDFGFNGSNFATLNAYTDITSQSRVITYNILPLTNKYGAQETRSRRSVLTENLNVFVAEDKVTIPSGGSVTRVAIEGELRSASFSVADVKANDYIIKLPSQHVDTTAIWIKTKSSDTASDFIDNEPQWIQCTSAAEFIIPEPRFMVSYDTYSNAQIQISYYLNELEDYDGNWLVVYWIDCSGTIGCVGTDVLSNLLLAVPGQDIETHLEDVVISNLSNTIELPHTNTVTGKSPETAKQAYFNSRNYLHTWDSLVTLPDFNRFLNREPGVDCGTVIDCQKALEINMAIYKDENLTARQKSKMYITNQDFPAGEPIYDWATVLDLGFNPEDPQKYVFAANFKRYTAMCFAVHNNFGSSNWGSGQESPAQISNTIQFIRYKPPRQFVANIKRDYKPLQAMTVDIDFGYLRVFPFYIVGQIYPKKPVSKDVANSIINKVKEDLRLYFDPANRHVGQKPTVMEVVNVIRNADSRIDYFDAGSLNNPVINWSKCDIEYFNPISFARYTDITTGNNIRISPEYLVD